MYSATVHDDSSELVKSDSENQCMWKSAQTSEGEYIWYELRRRPFWLDHVSRVKGNPSVSFMASQMRATCGIQIAGYIVLRVR